MQQDRPSCDDTRKALAAARTLLFVPGHRPERFGKAIASGADAVVLDLEDSVPPSAKQAAREAIANAWTELLARGVPLLVRLNGLVDRATLAWGRQDLQWLASLPRPPAAVMVPKAQCGAELAEVSHALPGVALLPLVESAEGLARLSSLAGTPGVLRLVVGHLDFMADTGMQCGDDEQELTPLRFAVAVESRCHDLAPAVDGVTVEIANDERLRADTRRALRFGFGGKLCIHPRQVGVVHEALRPTPAEVEWARRVVAAEQASGGAAVQVDGRMVDVPVVQRARRILARAAA